MQLTSRSKFLFMIGVFMLPVLAAYLAYFGWRPAGHTNYGELLKVAPLKQADGSLIDGKPFSLNALQGKWVMVYVGSGHCDADCNKQLYLMRQVRITQGKDQSRIERVWIVTDANTPDGELLKEHPGLYVWKPMEPGFVSQFSAAESTGAKSPAEHVFLVDPLGNLMLRFPAQPDAKRMMKDLKLLLKASQIG